MVSGFYSRLSADQVAGTYKLIKLLTRLRVIGTLECSTVSAYPDVDPLGAYDIIDMTMNIYAIKKLRYDPRKNRQDIEELLESLFGRKTAGLRGTP